MVLVIVPKPITHYEIEHLYTATSVGLTHNRCAVVVATLDWLQKSIKCGAATFEAVGIGPHSLSRGLWTVLVPARGLDTGERTPIVPAVQQMGVLNAFAMRALGNGQEALTLPKKLIGKGSASHVLQASAR